MGSILLAFLAEVGIITYRDLSGKDPSHTIVGMPLPADYIAAVALYGALGTVSSSSGAHRVAGMFGWGIVIATALNLWNPATPTSVGKSSSSSSSNANTTSTPSTSGASSPATTLPAGTIVTRPGFLGNST